MTIEVKIGDQIGPFRIIGRLGSGGAGAVYKAEHSETGELRALKTLTPGTVVNEEIHNRFVREISVAQKLGHPNVVAYDDCGLHEEILYYTMELVPWGSLADTLARRVRLGWRDAVECAMHISDGLGHLHAANIVHRDLKPENIFLSDEGRLKVGDFGLARDFNSTRLTLEGKTVGTLKYIAPEQAMAKSQIDGRTDIYALGCILFEMLAGGAPFVEDDPGSPAGYAQLMQKHIHEEPPAIAELVADCPASLSGLLSKMLAKNLATAQSAPEVKRMLANILAGKPVDFEGARKEKKSLAKTSTASTLTERLQNPDSQNRKSFPTALVITTIILLALAAIAIVSLF